MAKKTQKPQLYVTIRNREKVLKQDYFESLSSTNNVGNFDVLPQHAHYITLLKDYITLRKAGGASETMKIGQGALKVTDNIVSVYLDVVPPNPTQKPA